MGAQKLKSVKRKPSKATEFHIPVEKIQPIYPTAIYSRAAAAAVTGLSQATLRRAEQTGKLKGSKASDSKQSGRVVYGGMALLEFLGVPESVINVAIAAVLKPADPKPQPSSLAAVA